MLVGTSKTPTSKLPWQALTIHRINSAASCRCHCLRAPMVSTVNYRRHYTCKWQPLGTLGEFGPTLGPSYDAWGPHPMTYIILAGPAVEMRTRIALLQPQRLPCLAALICSLVSAIDFHGRTTRAAATPLGRRDRIRLRHTAGSPQPYASSPHVELAIVALGFLSASAEKASLRPRL